MIDYRTWQLVVLIGIFLVITACGPKRPAFYPNGHLKTVGKSQAEADADQCMAEAREYGVNDSAGNKVGKKAVKGAAIGATTSAVIAAILSGDVGRAIGAGAAGGATAGAVSGAFDAAEPDPVFKNYVNRCLREKGYEVIGWQ